MFVIDKQLLVSAFNYAINRLYNIYKKVQYTTVQVIFKTEISELFGKVQ